jgi:GTP-binding protein
VNASALAALVAETEGALAGHPAAFPRLIATSARTGSGIAELRGAIVRLLNERGHGSAAPMGTADG